MTEPVTYIPDFLNNAYAIGLFDALRSSLNWERRDNTPRAEYWTNTLGRDYTYGQGRGQRTYESQKTHWEIDAVRHYISHFGYASPELEGCFLNMYEDGKDALGWHSDDDPGIDHTRPIAVVTLGQGRPLQYREIGAKGHESIKTVDLAPGSLLLMHAGMQQTHVHRIPKIHEEIGPRISMTYRGLIS